MKTTNETELKIEKVNNLLSELSEISNDCYKPEYLPKISKWEKVGMTLARYTDNASNIALLAFSFFEDLNYHDIAFLLDWIFNLYPDNNGIHENDLNRIKNIFNKTVKTWKFGNGGIIERKQYRIKIIFEEVK